MLAINKKFNDWLMKWSIEEIQDLDLSIYVYKNMTPYTVFTMMKIVYRGNTQLALRLFKSHYAYNLLQGETFFSSQFKYSSNLMLKDIEWREIFLNYKAFQDVLNSYNLAQGINHIDKYHSYLYPSCLSEEFHNYRRYKSMFFTSDELRIIHEKVNALSLNKHDWKKRLNKDKQGKDYLLICKNLLRQDYDFDWKHLSSFSEIISMMNKKHNHVSYPFVVPKQYFKRMDGVKDSNWSFSVLRTENDFLVWSCSLNNCLDHYYASHYYHHNGREMLYLEALSEGLVAMIGIYHKGEKFAVMSLRDDGSVIDMRRYDNKELSSEAKKEILNLIVV